MSAREFDIVLMGATGFTGRLVAEHLVRRHGVGGQLKWALAGRSRERLETIRIELGEAAAGLPLITADSHDRESLDEMVQRTRVVCSTVGPYALHGSELVAACAASGTDYCDLAGEVPWMRRMLDAHADAAASSGARIVHCCGFDSIPSDMGVWFLQREANKRLGQPLSHVRMRVKAAKGGLSGGTYASMLNIVEEARRDREVARLLKNPYALCPPGAREGERQPYVSSATRDPVFKVWIAPFVMAAINTRVVLKSNAMSGFAYGEDFRYEEAIMTGRGFSGRMKATTVSLFMGAFALGAALAPTRALLKKMVLPKPGEGPSPQERESGFFRIVFDGRNEGAGQSLQVTVAGDRDPGYGCTSRMLGETALALALDLPAEACPGGIWTPSTALGEKLLERLEAHAGMTFEVLEAQDDA